MDTKIYISAHTAKRLFGTVHQVNCLVKSGDFWSWGFDSPLAGAPQLLGQIPREEAKLILVEVLLERLINIQHSAEEGLGLKRGEMAYEAKGIFSASMREAVAAFDIAKQLASLLKGA